MKSNAFYALIGVGVIVVGAIIWLSVHAHSHPSHTTSEPTNTATSTPSLVGMSIYTNGQYGFSVFYPGTDTATSTFATYYHLPNSWRVNALPDATGTPIVAIIGYQTQSDNSYPRYFDAEVRIGASSNPAEKAACLKAGDGETQQKDTAINGTTWKTFSFESAGMMQYAKGVSYRTIHDGSCVAMEQIETGSDYRDDPASSKDIPDSVLTQQYNDLAPIIQSFSFANS